MQQKKNIEAIRLSFTYRFIGRTLSVIRVLKGAVCKDKTPMKFGGLYREQLKAKDTILWNTSWLNILKTVFRDFYKHHIT